MRWYKPAESEKIFGLVLKFAPYAELLLTPFLAAFACYENLDPLYFLLKIHLKINFNWRKNLLNTLFIFISRYVLFLSSCYEMMRLIIAVGYVFIGVLWAMICIVFFVDQEYEESIECINQLQSKLIYVRYYNMLSIALNACRHPQNSIGLIMLGAVALGLVFLLNITLGFYSLIPFNVYIIAPTVAFIVIVIIHLIIPKVVIVGESSHDILRKWNSDLKLCTKSLYARKVMKSLQPYNIYIGFHSYRWLLLNREFNVNYYYTILDNTTMVLLSYTF